jgi:hypothetical protein
MFPAQRPPHPSALAKRLCTADAFCSLSTHFAAAAKPWAFASCSLQELSQLLLGLASLCRDAAEWLLGVGLTWATTCHLDMGQEGALFTEAGVWLLKAAAVASPQLAGQALASVLQHLTAGEQSAVWRVACSLKQGCGC